MAGILQGLRIVEGSAFVAAPLAGMTLAQMGADVIRFDRIQGGLDHGRWPVTASGRSLFWAGMNKGKRSIAVDLASPEGREVVTRLICEPGEGKGIFLTNLRVRGWMDYEALKARRDDLIMMSIIGDRAGNPHVDYTVNPAVGFPMATGPEDGEGPVGHVLPAWDCVTGQKAALGILAAERHRRLTGRGQVIEVALKDVALAMLGNLGVLAEVAINDVDRPKIGTSLYGAYAQDFVCACGGRVIVVAITPRQWDNLMAATGTREAMDALEASLGVDFEQEGARYEARRAITEVLKPFFAGRGVEGVEAEFTRAHVTWSRYRTFRAVLEQDPDCSTDNPMFATVDQPGVGTCLTPGSPLAFSEVERAAPVRAPALGENTDEILSEIGYADGEIARLRDKGVVAGP